MIKILLAIVTIKLSKRVLARIKKLPNLFMARTILPSTIPKEDFSTDTKQTRLSTEAEALPLYRPLAGTELSLHIISIDGAWFTRAVQCSQHLRASVFVVSGKKLKVDDSL